KAKMHCRSPLYAVESAVNGLDGILSGLLRAGLHPRFIELYYISPGCKQLVDFLMHGFGIGQSHAFLVAVVVVLGLLAHGKWPRDGHLDTALRMTAQKGDIAHLYRPRTPNGTDHSGDSDRLSTPPHRGARRGRIDAVQGRSKAIRVALAAGF